MLRIQLVIEDYGELISLQTMLKKVGFDVDATQNPVGLSDQLLTLNPDVVILTAHGRKVPGFDLAKQFRKVRGLPLVILLHEANRASEPDPAIQEWLPTPVDRERLLRVIAGICRLNEIVLLEKYNRFVQQQNADTGSITVGAGAAPAAASDPKPYGHLAASTLPENDRRERYQKFLRGTIPTAAGFGAKQVREQVKALRQAESEESNEDLEKERRAFVAQLFKK